MQALQDLLTTDNGEKVARIETLFYLEDRWQDEKEYEDFAEYIKVAKKLFDGTGYEFMRLTRGFKITVRKDGTTFRIGLNKDGFYTEKLAPAKESA